MTTRHTLTALTVSSALHGTNAGADTNGVPPWFDEDTDTSVYRFVGRLVETEKSETSERVHHGTTPYYDEDPDTVVYHFAGRPGAPAWTKSSPQASTRSTWFYDEDTGTVVYHHAGHRSSGRRPGME